MPWEHCGHQILDDQVCPDCGITKEKWTVEWNVTRDFKVKRKPVVRFVVLDGKGKPLEAEPYEVEIEGAPAVSGELDAFGFAKVPLGDATTCVLRFPNRPAVERLKPAPGEETAATPVESEDEDAPSAFTCQPGPKYEFRLEGLTIEKLAERCRILAEEHPAYPARFLQRFSYAKLCELARAGVEGDERNRADHIPAKWILLPGHGAHDEENMSLVRSFRLGARLYGHEVEEDGPMDDSCVDALRGLYERWNEPSEVPDLYGTVRAPQVEGADGLWLCNWPETFPEEVVAEKLTQRTRESQPLSLDLVPASDGAPVNALRGEQRAPDVDELLTGDDEPSFRHPLVAVHAGATPETAGVRVRLKVLAAAPTFGEAELVEGGSVLGYVLRGLPVFVESDALEARFASEAEAGGADLADLDYTEEDADHDEDFGPDGEDEEEDDDAA